MRHLTPRTLAALVLALAAAGSAHANTFSLRFQGGGPCFPGAASCTAWMSHTIFLDVVLILNVDRTQTSTSVGLDLSAVGLPTSAVTATAFDPPFGASVIPLNGDATPVGSSVPALEDTADAMCTTRLAGCDARFTSFGFTSPTPVGSGFTYTAGTIRIDLGQLGTNDFVVWEIVTYRNLDADLPPDGAANPRNSALLVIVPEPTTGWLLALGLIGLAMASAWRPLSLRTARPARRSAGAPRRGAR